VSEVSIPKLQRIIKKLAGRTDMGMHRSIIRRQIKSLKLLVFLSSRMSEDAIRHSLLKEMEKMQLDTYQLNEENLVAVALATKSHHSLQYALAPSNPHPTNPPCPAPPAIVSVQHQAPDMVSVCSCSTQPTNFGYPEPGRTESIFHHQGHKVRPAAPKESGAVLHQVAAWPLSLRDPQPTHASATWSGSSRLAHHKPNSSASRVPSRIEELLRLGVGASSLDLDSPAGGRRGAGGPSFMDYIIT
jgi:hypothetical protein